MKLKQIDVNYIPYCSYNSHTHYIFLLLPISYLDKRSLHFNWLTSNIFFRVIIQGCDKILLKIHHLYFETYISTIFLRFWSHVSKKRENICDDIIEVFSNKFWISFESLDIAHFTAKRVEWNQGVTWYFLILK